MANEKIKLFCILDGDSSAFPVKLAIDDTIGELKKAIKEEKKPRLDDIASDELVLFQVSIPIGDEEDDEDDKPVFLIDHRSNAKKIGAKKAATEISEVFGTSPPKKTIHAIIQRPHS
ncbi:hypothetical protein BGZ76_005819, partial [Entomortierella beljakovae]